MEHGYGTTYFRRMVGAGVTFAFLATAIAPAMAASSSPPDTPSAFSNKSIERAVATSTSDARARAERSPAAPKQATRSGSFFKTRTGAVVLIVMALGTGYAVYSAKEDRIKGINR